MEQKNLRKLNPCCEGLAYAESFPSLQEAWDKCDRGDWMLWLLARLSSSPTSLSRKRLVLTACACARLSLKYVPFGESRPREAIETAERWARGEGATLEDVRGAAIAASASAGAAAYASASAGAAAYAATAAATADTAATAAYAAAYATASAACATRRITLKQCADIVRAYYPDAPCIRSRR